MAFDVTPMIPIAIGNFIFCVDNFYSWSFHSKIFCKNKPITQLLTTLNCHSRKSKTMKSKILITILFLFALASCHDDAVDSVFDFGDELELKAGDIVGTNDRRVVLKLTDVNDSRCPTGVECFWQGEASVSFELNYNGITNFTLSSFHNPSDTIKNLSFKLISVEPYPISTREIELDDYIVKVEVQKIGD
jgi:hypothetical protein